MIFFIPTLFLVALIIPISLFPVSLQASPSIKSDTSLSQYILSPIEEQLLVGAPERIERYRKGDASVRVLDASGNPVKDASVHVEMLNHDFLFGCNLILDNYQTAERNKAYADSFARLFNYATLPFDWRSYEFSQGVPNKDTLSKMVSWARAHNMKVKGHPLVWDLYVPDWAPQSPDAFWDAQCTRTKRETQYFCGLMDFWTVMDEPVPDPEKDNILRRFMKARNPAAVTKDALDCAQKGCADAKLIVNDYQTNMDFHYLLEEVKKRGGKIDAIGLESHMHMNIWKLDQVWYVCDLFKDLGIPLHFTEATVLSGTLKTDQDWLSYHPDWNTTVEGEKNQADYVPLFYTILFSHPSVQSITWWDLSDEGAWQGAPAGLIRKDMSPKPAYNQLMKLIHNDWWTDITVSTDAEGKVSWRGFYGQYKLTAVSGQKKSESIIYLDKSKDNSFMLQLSEPKSLSYLWILIGIAIIAITSLWFWFYRKRK
jgi:endo-1,4-beta-xylanase